MARNKKTEEGTPQTFEERFQRLKDIVEQLSEGDLPLNELESVFKEGISLCQLCAEDLDRVEQSVQVLIKDSEERFRTEPFEREQE
ncbi:MAG TPA: exodeoxyribonuclease VII small subunit [bacterium]|nr:exodeoxyribonuclease VII small subunit [bacterium]